MNMEISLISKLGEQHAYIVLHVCTIEKKMIAPATYLGQVLFVRTGMKPELNSVMPVPSPVWYLVGGAGKSDEAGPNACLLPVMAASSPRHWKNVAPTRPISTPTWATVQHIIASVHGQSQESIDSRTMVLFPLHPIS
jgi:hypothetical protein